MLQVVQQKQFLKNRQIFCFIKDRFSVLEQSLQSRKPVLFYGQSKVKKDIKSSLLNFLRVILLIGICLISAFLIVWPLWKFSTSLSKIYTIVILTLITAFILYLILTKIRKCKPVKIFQLFINLIILISGICISIFLTLNLKRVLALIIIFILIIFEIIINKIFSKFTHA